MSATRIFIKLLTESGVGGDTERYRWFVWCRTAPDVDNEPRVRDLHVSRRALAVASAQNATAEDRFIEANRSVNIGDGEKLCHRESVTRRHLIAFLFNLDDAH
jgi:hypothetical protein